MGENDICMKSYLSDKMRFADLFNCIVGQGKELFTAKDLQEVNSVVALTVGNKDTTWDVTFGRNRRTDRPHALEEIHTQL